MATGSSTVSPPSTTSQARTAQWRDRLTEDQDLGLQLIGVGWEGGRDLRAVVEQQGLPNLRRLFRQRTRWSQGNLQAMSLIGTVVRAPVSLMARIEALAYLLMPLWQGIVGISFLAALVLLIIGEASLWDQSSSGNSRSSTCSVSAA